MTPYAQLPTHKPEEYLRIVGLSPENFLHLHGKLAAYLDEQKAVNPLTRRGRKDSKLTLEDRLLLTLYYRKALLEDPAATLAIDVSEQPIERPVKNQKAYYSGKKTSHGQSPARDLPIDAGHPVRGGG
jgi:hypothetical protein